MADTTQELQKKFKLLAWKASFLLLILFVYLSIGAIIFHLIEYNARQSALQEAVEELEENRAQFLKVLWAGAIAKSEDDWTLLANERLDMYEKELVDNVRRENLDISNPDSSANRWSLEGSFFYCFTTITTIGYGNIAPSTPIGKIATIMYGLIGIPATLYFISVIGKFLTVTLKLWFSRFSNSFNDSSDEFNFGIPILVLLLALYFGLGAALFGYVENWTWLDAGYFSFITFTTVGLGDLFPENLEIAIFASLFIFSALSLFALIFNVFQQFAEIYLEQLYNYFSMVFTFSKSKAKNATEVENETEVNNEKDVNIFSRIPLYQTPGFTKNRKTEVENEER